MDAEDRRSRCRVISGPQDERLQLDKFKNAKLIVANNDARYEINKVRAQEYARSTGASLQWSVATDKASSTVLQSEVCSKQTKIRWLRYHDRDTGDLPGMLPIGLGMPVALTDHIDRGSKLLLRGRIGFVVAVDWSAGHRQPSVVFLKFDNVDWQLDGTSEPGVYPIEPVTRTWFLDRNKPKPVLKVVRRQLPLCPAFAITAHFSQGKTMEAAILDLMIDKIADVSYGTVATSRVRSRDDVLILRPFPLWLHQRGSQISFPAQCAMTKQERFKDFIIAACSPRTNSTVLQVRRAVRHQPLHGRRVGEGKGNSTCHLHCLQRIRNWREKEEGPQDSQAHTSMHALPAQQDHGRVPSRTAGATRCDHQADLPEMPSSTGAVHVQRLQDDKGEGQIPARSDYATNPAIMPGLPACKR